MIRTIRLVALWMITIIGLAYGQMTVSAQGNAGEPAPSGFGGAAPGAAQPDVPAFDPFSTPPGIAPGAPVAPGEAPPMAVPRVKPDGTMYIRLRDGSYLFGKLADVKQLRVKATIGEVTVPLTKIASLEFTAPKTAKIRLRNGDRITGELNVDKLKLTAQWGEVTIDAKFVKHVISKDLARGFQPVRRAIIEVTPDGRRTTRYIEELVPVGDTPAGAFSAGVFPGAPAEAIPGAPPIGPPVPSVVDPTRPVARPPGNAR